MHSHAVKNNNNNNNKKQASTPHAQDKSAPPTVFYVMRSAWLLWWFHLKKYQMQKNGTLELRKRHDLNFSNKPSKHAGSNLHLVRISWEALARSGPDDSCTVSCFWTGSIWLKSDTVSQNWTGFAQYYLGRLWKNGIKSESGKLVAGWLHPARNRARRFLCTGLLPHKMRLVKAWPGHPDQIQVGFAQYDSLIYAFSGKMELKWIREVGSGIHNLARFRLHASHNDHNWL